MRWHSSTCVYMCVCVCKRLKKGLFFFPFYILFLLCFAISKVLTFSNIHRLKSLGPILFYLHEKKKKMFTYEPICVTTGVMT